MIILASQSPARKRILKRLGFKFRTVPAHLDEASFKEKSPRALVRRLAFEKAKSVATRYPKAVVIGSDQMLVLGRRVFGKPHTEAKAREQLKACSGRTVELLTAVTILEPAKVGGGWHEVHHLNVTKMKFHHLTLDEIRDYIAEDRPLECAGSFMIEKKGLRLFESIQTDDATAIEGLPALKVNQILRHSENA